MNPTTQSILEHLRQGTRFQHEALEKIAQSDKLGRGALSESEYQGLLVANFWAHLGLESALERTQDMLRLLPDWPERKKLKLLVQDLEKIGLAAGQLEAAAPLAQMPELHTEAQAWGVLYVMEGSSLGGVLIARALNKISHLQDYTPSHFYGCYGPKTGYYWKEFRDRITGAFHHAHHALSEQEAVAAACQTFSYYQICFKQASAQV